METRNRSQKLLLILSTLVFVAGCDSYQGPSAAEEQTLLSSAFSHAYNVNNNVGNVDSSKDAIPASRPFHTNDITEAIAIPVRDCTTPGLYEMERQMALNEAAEDPTGQTVPVKFSYSFGKKHDLIAKYANERAILSASNPGYSYIPVGPRRSGHYKKKGKKITYYYKADNTKVAHEYKTGEKCFFSTIHVDKNSGVQGRGKYNFIDIQQSDLRPGEKVSKLRHAIHMMYYGYCKVGRCDSKNGFAGEYANRLFTEVPSIDSDGSPQIVKLYVADLRSEQLVHDVVRLSEETRRGLELETKIDNILDVCEVHRNYFDVTKNLSFPKEVNGYEFSRINGAVQLVNNILSHDVDGTILSSQYTPIVLDLNGDGIKTSSVRWGTYFNMANLRSENQKEGEENLLAHRTAWIGGDYVDYNHGSNQDPRVKQDIRIKASDGFLVIPDDRGLVHNSAQMFGDNIQIGGKTYDNGFLALQAFAGKSCQVSGDVTAHYVGPWDGDIYENQLKVWVDEDRDGITDEGELKSLRELGIAAINACNIVHTEEYDSFGNGTALRSAMLVTGPDKSLLNRPTEIKYYLAHGEGYDGEEAHFRLVVDLIFQVDEEKRCEAESFTMNYESIGIGSANPQPIEDPDPTPNPRDPDPAPNNPDPDPNPNNPDIDATPNPNDPDEGNGNGNGETDPVPPQIPDNF